MKNLSITLIFCALWACDSSRLYEQNVDFDNKIWIADSSATFRFDIDDKDKLYNLYLNIRNTNTYTYRNLYVQYTLEDTTGSEIKKELVNNNLFHEKTGKPLGSGLGDIFSHQFLLLENYRFDSTNTYQIRLQQFMRQDSLNGIISAGLRVEAASSDD